MSLAHSPDGTEDKEASIPNTGVRVHSLICGQSLETRALGLESTRDHVRGAP